MYYIAKDIEDVEGDGRGRARTFPTHADFFGPRPAPRSGLGVSASRADKSRLRVIFAVKPSELEATRKPLGVECHRKITRS